MSLWNRFRFGPGAKTDSAALATPASAPPPLGQICTLIAKNDLPGARELLDSALSEADQHPELRLLSAQVHRLSGNPTAGLADCDLALTHASDPSQVQLEMAQCWLAMPDIASAIDCLHVAVTLDPGNGAAWLQLGEVFRRIEQTRDAQDAYAHATTTLKTAEEQANAWFLLGQSLMYSVDLLAAREAFETSLKLNPDLLESYVGLGNAALWLDDEPAAVTFYEEALRRSMHPGRLLLLNLGSALQNCGRFEEAQSIFARVVAEQPRDHTSRWYLCQLDLALCRWSEGWSNYPSRFGSGATAYRPMPYKPWDGREAKDDTLLILADEGIGDEIMYASCFNEAAARVKHVIIECETRLQPLFKRSFPNLSVVGTRRENDPSWLADLPTPNWQIPSGDLPGVFRRHESNFPRHRGYLNADPSRVAHWRRRLDQDLGPGLKVGISWRGGTTKTRTRTRSLDADQWAPIFAVPGVQFVNLQYGDYAAELTRLNQCHGTTVHDYPTAISDYDETAALVSALDLVVTVCTAIVHLCGALGRPVWVMTPLAPGWRYTANRSTMPWYPSSRLFRQTSWGEWAPVCREVSTALAALTNSVSPPAPET